ncbi:MAG TPA: DEAD/DEAH box helicase, partial [Microlunatus sp.]|nr:DEAD/DEAH box helicase [Microlunatus sp.]
MGTSRAGVDAAAPGDPRASGANPRPEPTGPQTIDPQAVDEQPVHAQPMDGLEIRHRRDLPARPGRRAPWPAWLEVGSPARAAVERIGIDALWTHQARAADALVAGRHVVLTTGTASGKSLAYLLPSATAAVGAWSSTEDDAVRWRRRPATSLYLAPTKALAHDQARVCAELGVPGWRIATVDGDTDPADRQWARDHAHHVLTNPDLLHASLLPNHTRWASFLRSLRYVVVDESHRYRGVFGAQVAAVLRRLRRLAAHYRADPTFALLSATTTDPLETAAALTGIAAEDLTLVDDDGSVRGAVRISLARSEHAPEIAAAELMAARVRAGEQVLTFVPSRRLAEEVARTADTSVGASPSQSPPGGCPPGGASAVGSPVAGLSAAGASAGGRSASVVAYRAGYLASDRRLIERGLADGTLRGVAATNALELGVDIAGLDTVVLCGYPGSRAAFWQQAGRAGRRGAAAEVVMIARPHPLDAYLLDHPDALFDLPVETTVLDPASPAVLGPQLAAAAQELPLRPGDEHWFGAGTWALVARLTERGLLRRRPDGWFWTAPRRAVDRISLRSTDAHPIDIVEEPTGRVLGTVGLDAADLVVHPGAVYLHQGESYLCDDDGWEAEAGEVIVRAARPGYLTQPVVDAEVSPGPFERERRLGYGRLAYGPSRVSSTVTGFLRRDELTGRVWDSTPLERPERVLSTAATTLTLAPDAAGVVGSGGAAPTGGAGSGLSDVRPELSRPRFDAGIHALEHLVVGVLPALLANDRYDVGSHSWIGADGAAVIAIFDRRPGSGFAAGAYER